MLQFSRSSCLIGDETWEEVIRERELIDIYQFNSSINHILFQWRKPLVNPPSIIVHPITIAIGRHPSQITLQQAYSQRKCNMRSKIQWLTDFCSSHYVSQFAAFFIDSRAKISIVKSYNNNNNEINHTLIHNFQCYVAITATTHNKTR